MSIVNGLKASKLFGSLTPSEIEKVAGICRSRKFESGQMIFPQGSEAGGFFVISKGTVKVFQLSPDGKEHLLHTFHPTESFGEAAAFGLGIFPANAGAVEDTKLIIVPIHEFKELLKTDTELAVKMIAGLSMLLHVLVEQIHSLTLKDAKARVAEYILSLTDRKAPKNKVTVELPMKKNDIAMKLGIKQETLSRTFKRLQTERTIKVDGKKITIENVAALRNIADIDL